MCFVSKLKCWRALLDTMGFHMLSRSLFVSYAGVLGGL